MYFLNNTLIFWVTCKPETHLCTREFLYTERSCIHQASQRSGPDDVRSENFFTTYFSTKQYVSLHEQTLVYKSLLYCVVLRYSPAVLHRISLPVPQVSGRTCGEQRTSFVVLKLRINVHTFWVHNSASVGSKQESFFSVKVNQVKKISGRTSEADLNW